MMVFVAPTGMLIISAMIIPNITPAQGNENPIQTNQGILQGETNNVSLAQLNTGEHIVTDGRSHFIEADSAAHTKCCSPKYN